MERTTKGVDKVRLIGLFPGDAIVVNDWRNIAGTYCSGSGSVRFAYKFYKKINQPTFGTIMDSQS
jgi:hypothetical protein